jgi:hypothetical protein
VSRGASPVTAAVRIQDLAMFEKLTNMTKKRIDKWDKTRRKGKYRFILLNGVAGWGLLMFIIMTAFFHIQKVGFRLNEIQGISCQIVLINALIWPIGGFVWGACVWSINERLYLKYVNNSGDADKDNS